ncbi:MAG: glycine zipper family protein [Actinomycetota bacterium]|nr:glycine zipper family protein [Actinomycetota bacterium]
MQSDTQLRPRHLVASFTSYADAERAVDSLSDDGFPVERLTIVAGGLQLVENVTGRRGYGQAALGSAASGAVIGALLGLFLGLFSLVDPVISGFALAVVGAAFGSVIGAVAGMVSHWISAGRRDFSSVRSVEAGRYDLFAETAEHAEQAAQALMSPQFAPNA